MADHVAVQPNNRFHRGQEQLTKTMNITQGGQLTVFMREKMNVSTYDALLSVKEMLHPGGINYNGIKLKFITISISLFACLVQWHKLRQLILDARL